MTVAEDLFRVALHLTAPWFVNQIKFIESDKKIQIWVDFLKGSRFQCPKCNKLDCEIHDTALKTWRHLNFFEHLTYIHCRVPRVKCPDCGVHQVKVPWAREYSGFTLLMEALIVLFAQTMQITHISEKIKVTDKRIWRVIEYHVTQALKKSDFSDVNSVGIDETSRAKGHEYISIVADIETKRILHICSGKDASVLNSFSKSLEEHKGDKQNIKYICCDMSPAFIKGIKEEFPGALLIFDKFHIMKLVNEAVDQVRREEQGTNRVLKKTRYIWLKNPENLTKKQLKTLGTLKDMNLKTSRAYNIKLSLQLMWSVADAQLANAYFKKWFFWATHSKIEPIIKVAKTLKAHWNGILNYFKNKISNGLLEGLNSLIQSLKANARGYANENNFMTMIYLRHGQLKLDLPT